MVWENTASFNKIIYLLFSEISTEGGALKKYPHFTCIFYLSF